MTKHTDNYPALQDKKLYKRLLALERRISGRTGNFIPKSGFARVEPKIENGNLIGVTTDIEGLDVTHVGFALWVKNHVHLLHASQEEKQVAVSEKTLEDYLDAKKTASGIIVGQVQPMLNVPKKKYLNNY